MEIYPGQITLLYGESGSGKTTLLKEFALKHKFAQEYKYNQENLLELSETEKRNFIYQHISYVSQDPELLDDLTIEEHIHMLQIIFGTSIDVETYINMLDLKDIIKQYPSQLSGGEKKRAAMLLALIKDSDLIILDEPTASLDLESASKVYELIVEMKKLGKSILISTHDEEMMKYADVRYKLEDRRLVLETLHDMTAETELKTKEKNINKVHKYLSLMLNHHMKAEKIFRAFVVICITLFAISIEFTNYVTNINNSTFSKGLSTLIVYHQDQGAESFGYHFSGDGLKPITIQQVEQLKNIPHIKKAEWRFDINLGSPFALYLPYLQENLNNHAEFKVTMRKEDGTETVFCRSKQEIDGINLSTFTEDMDDANDMLFDFQQDGVYITKDLALTLSGNLEELKTMKMLLDIYVPVYYQYGYNSILSDDGKQVYLTTVACVPVPMELTIAGILKESNTGVDQGQGNGLYIRRSKMEELVNDYKEDKPRTLYEAFLYTDNFENDKDDIFYDHLPANAEKKYTEIYKIDYVPWSPAAYTITVDSAAHMERVINEIMDIGLNVSNAYANYHAISQGTESMQMMIHWSSYVSALILMIMTCLIKLNERDQSKKLHSYFTGLGLTNLEIKKIKSRYYRRRAMNLSILCGILAVLLYLMDSSTQIIGIHLSLGLLLPILGMSFLVECLLPILVERGNYHD